MPTKSETKRATERSLRAYMKQASRPGRTKRTAARLALSAAMGNGVLKPGDLLPSEQELTGILGVSLGTVQVALRQLQEIGVIVRRRGDGSRVASTEPLTSAIWHFRFINRRDGSPIHPVAELVNFDVVKSRGVWSRFLGELPAYLRISRRYGAADCAPFGAEMFLDPHLVPGLADSDPDEWTMVNIRAQLEARYGVVIQGTTQTVQLASPGYADAARLGIESTGPIYEIHAETHGRMHKPIYFQRLFVPAEDYALNFSTGPRP